MILNYSIDPTAILISAFICFSFAALWFSPALFGKLWLLHMGKRNEEVHQLINLRTFTLVFLFILFFCASVNIVVDNIRAVGLAQGVETGIIIWFVISFSHAAVHFTFEHRSKILFVIYSGYYLVASVLSSSLFAMWR